MKVLFRKTVAYLLRRIFPGLRDLLLNEEAAFYINSSMSGCKNGYRTKLYMPYHIFNSTIGDYSYIAQNSWISLTQIGKFCSIGPNVLCGWGIHPTDFISTHPMFYSNLRQNGHSLSDINLIEERKPITIGNDVFIGANVTILDGVNIGNGAIIGAGSLVNNDILPYSIVAGVPAKTIRMRFDEATVTALETIQWWNFSDKQLQSIKDNITDPGRFIKIFSDQNASF